MKYWRHLPYSHSSSFLCKMQTDDQILGDKLNMPVFVLKYSINLKGVQRFFIVPVCNHFLTSPHRMYASSSVTLSAGGLFGAFYCLGRFQAEAVKWHEILFKGHFTYWKENVTSQKGENDFLPFISSTWRGLGWLFKRYLSVAVVWVCFGSVSKWQ